MTDDLEHTSYGSIAQLVAQVADYIRRGDEIDVNVVIGPIVWQLKGDLRQWYFVVASADHQIARFDQLASDPEGHAEEFRAGLMLALVQKRPIVIHDTDDELYMAHLCESLWISFIGN